MKLSLALSRKNKINQKNGITRINLDNLVVIDNETGNAVENLNCIVWCSGNALLDIGLLTKDHLNGDGTESYGVCVFRCDAAIKL